MRILDFGSILIVAAALSACSPSEDFPDTGIPQDVSVEALTEEEQDLVEQCGVEALLIDDNLGGGYNVSSADLPELPLDGPVEGECLRVLRDNRARAATADLLRFGLKWAHHEVSCPTSGNINIDAGHVIAFANERKTNGSGDQYWSGMEAFFIYDDNSVEVNCSGRDAVRLSLGYPFIP